MVANRSSSGLGSGLTDNEQTVILRWCTELSEMAEKLRRMGKRLERDS
jgi:hypothetical protein